MKADQRITYLIKKLSESGVVITLPSGMGEGGERFFRGFFGVPGVQVEQRGSLLLVNKDENPDERK